MKMRHKETGEMINLPDFILEYEDAKEIARVFLESAELTSKTDLPPDIVSLKTYTEDIILVSQIAHSTSLFSYEKLIRIHLHLPPYKFVDQQKKSIVWSIRVNGRIWSVGETIFDHIIQRLEWTNEFGWWAITDGVFAVQLERIDR